MGRGIVRPRVPLPSGRTESSIPGTVLMMTTSRVTSSVSGNIKPDVSTYALWYCTIADGIILTIANTSNLGIVFIINI